MGGVWHHALVANTCDFAQSSGPDIEIDVVSKIRQIGMQRVVALEAWTIL